ncbi:hypothetical protein ACHAO7_011078 [Fusarium culmorum]
MPYRLDTHVLTVDTSVIHKVDTGNPANLYNMWTAFSRETFVVDNEEKTAPTTETLPQNIQSDSRISDLPQLSGSVDSLVGEEAVDFAPVSAPLQIARPRVRRQDSCARTRSERERHISSEDFDKIIVSIVKDKGSLSRPAYVVPVAKEPLPMPPVFERSGPTTTESQSPAESTTEGSPQPSPQNHSRTTVVRGFSPSQIIYGAQSSDVIPKLKSSPAAKVVQSKKSACFARSCSCSSSEQDQSLSVNKPIISIIKKPVFQIGDSSEQDGSLKNAMASSRPSSLLSARKKQAYTRNNVMNPSTDNMAVVDSDSDDYIDESAIDDDDDSSDWEDSMEESGKSSMDDSFFQRVDSKPNMTSRRSLITLMLAQNDHTHHVQPQAALSPRTTRRNMLATELTESLRGHLLWEGQQKSSTANAVLKRRHTSHDVANLKQFPGKPCMKQSEDVNASSWNQYFSKEAGIFLGFACY